jgi:hypothetical protein
MPALRTISTTLRLILISDPRLGWPFSSFPSDSARSCSKLTWFNSGTEAWLAMRVARIDEGGGSKAPFCRVPLIAAIAISELPWTSSQSSSISMTRGNGAVWSWRYRLVTVVTGTRTMWTRLREWSKRRPNPCVTCHKVAETVGLLASVLQGCLLIVQVALTASTGEDSTEWIARQLVLWLITPGPTTGNRPGVADENQADARQVA